MPNLFDIGHYVLASGLNSEFKIDCDALNFKELRSLVFLARKILPPFGEVHGVPTGGERLARELEPFKDPESSRILVVDDVWTTGGSMQRFCEEGFSEYADLIGLVLFARGPVDPFPVSVLFTLNENLWREQWPMGAQ